jgi:hypothetical protein
MTHRTRHIQTRAPVELLRFPILFPDSAPDPLLALDSASENIPAWGSNRVTAIVSNATDVPSFFFENWSDLELLRLTERLTAENCRQSA